MTLHEPRVLALDVPQVDTVFLGDRCSLAAAALADAAWVRRCSSAHELAVTCDVAQVFAFDPSASGTVERSDRRNSAAATQAESTRVR